MKQFLTISALALAMTVAASATTYTTSNVCGAFQDSLANAQFSTTGVNITGYPQSPAATCNIAADVPGGDTLVSYQIQFTSAFTSGNPSGASTTIVVTDANGSFSSYSNTNTSSAYSGSETNTGLQSGTTITTSSATTDAVNVTSAMLNSGAIQSLTGDVYETVTYQTQGGTPEPTTFVLMGAGLGLLGMLRRRAVRRQSSVNK
jgi:hypothetical protein